MTQKELNAKLHEQFWYKELGDTKVYPLPSDHYLIMIACSLIYPLLYDGTQMMKQGSEYFTDPWNYIDILHIGLGYANIGFQIYLGTQCIFTKTILIIVIFIQLIKTFFFMRIFQDFSYIVTMIINVIIDLRVFLLFFTILVVMFSLVFDVLNRNESSEYMHMNYFMRNVLTTLRLSLGDFSPDFALI